MTAAQYFRGVVAAVYVAVCLMIAAVRWFHMCRPYDREPNYYYPARLTTTLIYLSSLILLPYVFRPDSPMAWLLVKAYLLPVNLYFMTALLLSYFGRVMHWKRWPHLLMLGIPALLALLSIPLLAGRTFEEGVSGYTITSWMILISGGLMTFVCLYAVGLVLQWTRTVSDEEYSNPNDYPVAFARKSIGMLLITMVLLWITALSDNPAVVALVQLVLSVMSAWMLILALHPHRHRTVQEEQEQAPSPDAASSRRPISIRILRCRTWLTARDITVPMSPHFSKLNSAASSTISTRSAWPMSSPTAAIIPKLRSPKPSPKRASRHVLPIIPSSPA